MTNSDAGGYRLEIVHQARVAEVASLPGNSANETTVQYFNSIGSIEGRLEAASVRNQPYLRVYDAVHDKGVKCYFSDHQLEQVRSGLGKRVIVSGNVRSNRLGNPESMRVSKIEVVDDSAERVMPSDLRGLWRGETEGMKAEHYIREVRGDE